MVDPDDGTILERRGLPQQDLVAWDGDDMESRGGMAGYGERFVTRFGLVAYTGNLGQGGFSVPRAGPVVLDATTGEALAYAPIRDRDSVYSDNGHLTALGFLDEETVLPMVRPMDFRTMEPEEGVSHLVAWTYQTVISRCCRRGDRDLRLAAFAPALIDAPLSWVTPPRAGGRHGCRDRSVCPRRTSARPRISSMTSVIGRIRKPCCVKGRFVMKSGSAQPTTAGRRA